MHAGIRTSTDIGKWWWQWSMSMTLKAWKACDEKCNRSVRKRLFVTSFLSTNWKWVHRHLVPQYSPLSLRVKRVISCRAISWCPALFRHIYAFWWYQCITKACFYALHMSFKADPLILGQRSMILSCPVSIVRGWKSLLFIRQFSWYLWLFFRSMGSIMCFFFCSMLIA